MLTRTVRVGLIAMNPLITLPFACTAGGASHACEASSNNVLCDRDESVGLLGVAVPAGSRCTTTTVASSSHCAP